MLYSGHHISSLFVCHLFTLIYVIFLPGEFFFFTFAMSHFLRIKTISHSFHDVFLFIVNNINFKFS